MASIVPKIKVGLSASRREKHNLSFDCSTTANIGSIQPTMCRELVPNSKINVKVSSLVRLASMPLPTFGRMSLRHYHAFVPYVDLWQPFDAFMSGQHYKGSNSATFIPNKVPFFTMGSIVPFILSYADISIARVSDMTRPFYITSTNVDFDGNVYKFGEGEAYATKELAIAAAQAADMTMINSAWSAVRSGTGVFGGAVSSCNLFNLRGSETAAYRYDEFGHLNFGSYSGFTKGNVSTLKLGIFGVSGANVCLDQPGTVPISYEGADLITKVGDYYLFIKFMPFLKRLRTIFIGLGFQFSPYNVEEMSVLKLLAYYKTWFNLFSPVREKAFIDTTCYYLIKSLSEVNGKNAATESKWQDFITELGNECYYYLPMDYFSMSVVTPQQSNQDSDFILNSGATKQVTSGAAPTDANVDNVTVKSGSPTSGHAVVEVYSGGAENPLTMRLAQRLLTWANKNTILGRSVRQYLKVHFGIDDTTSIDDGSVFRVGSSRTNIQISDVMSTAENAQGYLGEYGGKGIGYGDSEKFDFSTDKFGVFLTLTCVVPESGYYQGYLKENRHLNRYQFFNPEFDAMGYQVLERGEVMDDFNADSGLWNPKSSYLRTGAFGLVPRYSEYKVGRNVVNGDLSLAGLKNEMSPYTLDRRFAQNRFIDSLDGSTKVAVSPTFVPSVVYDAFRRIDPTDHIGQYNRIFNYGGNDIDHFIIHNIFDVTLSAPMKSLSESFDTVASDDDGTIDVTHS